MARKATAKSAQERTAVYCGTRNLYADMETAAKSLLRNTPSVERVWFLIEDDEFPSELPGCISVKNVSGQKWFKPDGPNFKSHWTWMVLMRAALSKVFPKLDRVLSLDCDTIVEADIGELWELPMEDEYFAAVREPRKSTADFLYCNFGVAMLNLKKLRKDKKDDEVIAALNGRHFDANEQDAMNELCQGHICRLPGDYNISDWTDPFMGRKIRHYAWEGPNWRANPLVSQYRRMPWAKVRPEENSE